MACRDSKSLRTLAKCFRPCISVSRTSGDGVPAMTAIQHGQDACRSYKPLGGFYNRSQQHAGESIHAKIDEITNHAPCRTLLRMSPSMRQTLRPGRNYTTTTVPIVAARKNANHFLDPAALLWYGLNRTGVARLNRFGQCLRTNSKVRKSRRSLLVRNMNRYLNTIIILLLLSRFGIANEHLVKREIVLEPRAPGKFQWDHNFQLGSCPSGGTIELTVELTNRLGREVSFDGFDSHCSCTVASKTLESLKQGESGEFKISINIDGTGRRPVKKVAFVLYDTTRPQDRLRVECQFVIEGFLAFSQPHFIVKFKDWEKPTKEEPVQIPFAFTSPTQVRDLQVRATGGLEKFKLGIMQRNDEEDIGVVEISVRRSDVPDGGLFGSIFLIDGAARKECQVSISRLREFEITPRKLVLVWDAAEESYVGNAMLRVHRNPRENSFVSSDNPLKLNVEIKSQFECRTKSLPLNPDGTIQRLLFSVTGISDEQLATKNPAQISLVGEGKRYWHETEFEFIK